MIRQLLPNPLFAVLYAGALPYANSFPQSGVNQPAQPKFAPKTAAASLTGCVDPQESHDDLIDERNLKPLASLEADGFPTEGFAKYLGQNVTVRGIVSSNGTIPAVNVRSIEMLSEICAPQQR